MSIEQRVADWRLFTDEERASITNDFNAFINSDAYAKMAAVIDTLSQYRSLPKVPDLSVISINDESSSESCADNQDCCNSESSDNELDPDLVSAIAWIIDDTSSPETEVFIDHKRVTYSKELRCILDSGRKALRGIDISGYASRIVARCVREIRGADNKLCIHEDSLTGWVNRATELFHLTAGNIRAMKEGEQLEVVLFDRNLGDYTHGKAAGTTYDPITGCQLAIYTHKFGLSGSLLFPDIADRPDDFVWEVNGYAIGADIFWRPLDGRWSCGGPNLCEQDAVPDAVPIGWRGPCIRKSNALKYLPRSVMHYDTWYDNYVPFRYSNYLTMDRLFARL